MINPQQNLFIEHYTAIGTPTYCNATESAKAAEYSANSAHVTGWRLLRNAKIIRAIEQKRRRLSKKARITVEECIEVLTDDVRDSKVVRKEKYRAIELLADLKGWKRELAPNAEKEAEKRARMDKEAAKVAEKVARLRTDEESGEAKIVKIG